MGFATGNLLFRLKHHDRPACLHTLQHLPGDAWPMYFGHQLQQLHGDHRDYDGGSSGTGTLRQWRFSLRVTF